jgi:hypothetical protein
MKLPEHLLKKIQDEATDYAFGKEYNNDPYDNAYTSYIDGMAAAISNPGAYGLAGRWVKASDMAAKTADFITVVARYKDEIFSSGYFVRNGELFICHCDNYPIESSQFHELYIWDESAPPVDKVGELVKALDEIAVTAQTSYDMTAAQLVGVILKIATNALKQYNP